MVQYVHSLELGHYAVQVGIWPVHMSYLRLIMDTVVVAGLPLPDRPVETMNQLIAADPACRWSDNRWAGPNLGRQWELGPVVRSAEYTIHY